MIKDDLRKIFEKQLRAEIKLESDDHIKSVGSKTYFGRKISTSDKMLFAFVIERISGTQIFMQLALITERDFPDLNKNFVLDKNLTQKQFEEKNTIGMPVFIKEKVLSEYMYLKGIKLDDESRKK